MFRPCSDNLCKSERGGFACAWSTRGRRSAHRASSPRRRAG